jgi:RNA polymerase sigma factor (sigma-70 family)
MYQIDVIIPSIFKAEYRKIVSVLCRGFGLKHIEIAEDITNDTFLLATETWQIKGLPENPTAWLYTVAKNKTKDYLKHNKVFSEKIEVEIAQNSRISEDFEPDLSSQNIHDSQLLMIFAVCNPAIPSEAQVGLALRILCGFGIEEIAEAFLSNKETINKRLFRAKEKLKTENFEIQIEDPNQIDERLDSVLKTIYLVFNEGYYSGTSNKILKKELCLEAIRLCYFLIENQQTNLPKVNALMALMCFHASRLVARTDDLGNSILYDDQNRELWDEELIAKANYYLIQSVKGQELTKYHLEASIAYWHSTKTDAADKWEHILQNYNLLLQIEYSPIVALNRTYALSRAESKDKALVEALKINLIDNRLFHSLLGYLFEEKNPEKAIEEYQKAIELSKNDNEKSLLLEKIAKLKEFNE